MLHSNLQLVGFINTIFYLIFYEIKLTQFGSNKRQSQFVYSPVYNVIPQGKTPFKI